MFMTLIKKPSHHLRRLELPLSIGLLRPGRKRTVLILSTEYFHKVEEGHVRGENEIVLDKYELVDGDTL